MLKCPLCHANYVDLIEIETRYFRCEVCDLRFLDPQFRLAPEQEFARYQTHNNDIFDEGYRNFNKPILEEIKQRLKAGSTGLDFGAGPGPVLAHLLREEGYTISLFDPFFWPDQNLLKQKYDFIFACEVVEHFYDPHNEFTRLKSIINPGGFLFVGTQIYRPSIEFRTWYYRNDPTHTVFYSEMTLQWIQHSYEFSHLEIIGSRVLVFGN